MNIKTNCFYVMILTALLSRNAVGQIAIPSADGDNFASVRALIQQSQPKLSSVLNKEQRVIRRSVPSMSALFDYSGIKLDTKETNDTASQLWRQLRTKYPFVAPTAALTQEQFIAYVNDEGIINVETDRLQKRFPNLMLSIKNDEKTLVGSDLLAFRQAVGKASYTLSPEQYGTGVALIYRDLRTREDLLPPSSSITPELFKEYTIKRGAYIIKKNEIARANPSVSEITLSKDQDVIDSFRKDIDKFIIFDDESDNEEKNAVAASVWERFRVGANALKDSISITMENLKAYTAAHGWLKVVSKPIEGAKVTVGGTPQDLRTNRCMVDLPPGKYDVVVDVGDPYQPITIKDVEVKSGRKTTQIVVLVEKPNKK